MSDVITYGTKEEHNKRREQEFLKLSNADRLIWFLNAISKSNTLPTQYKKDRSNHFVITNNGTSI
jgi:hypothetical protein